MKFLEAYKRVEEIKQLLENDANVKKIDHWDNTVLFSAISSGYTNVVKLLLENG